MFAHSYIKSYHERAMVEERHIRPAKQFSFQVAAERGC